MRSLFQHHIKGSTNLVNEANKLIECADHLKAAGFPLNNKILTMAILMALPQDWENVISMVTTTIKGTNFTPSTIIPHIQKEYQRRILNKGRSTINQECRFTVSHNSALLQKWREICPTRARGAENPLIKAQVAPLEDIEEKDHRDRVLVPIKEYKEAPSYIKEDFTYLFAGYSTDAHEFQKANNPECNVVQVMEQDQPIASSSKLTIQQLDQELELIHQGHSEPFTMVPKVDIPEELYEDSVNPLTHEDYDYDGDEGPIAMCKSANPAKSYKISYSFLNPIPEYIRWESKDIKEEDLYYLVQ
ncbi:hypothetical protein V8B97DRAFT_1919552 [Scleroderma yunnanense]